MFVVNNSVCVVKNIKLFGFMLLTASEFIVNQQIPFSHGRSVRYNFISSKII